MAGNLLLMSDKNQEQTEKEKWGNEVSLSFLDIMVEAGSRCLVSSISGGTEAAQRDWARVWPF